MSELVVTAGLNLQPHFNSFVKTDKCSTIFPFSLSENYIIEITVTPNVAFSCVQLFKFSLTFLQNVYFP